MANSPLPHATSRSSSLSENPIKKIAESIVRELKKEMNVIYDESGSIGRRYARHDEIGTPYCITIDGDSGKVYQGYFKTRLKRFKV